MNSRQENQPTNLALTTHERTVDSIRDKYIQGPVVTTAQEDARAFFESKLKYSESAPPDHSFEDEIRDCKESLEEAGKGNWNRARRALLRSCYWFLDADDEGMDEIAIAFANLANSLPKNSQEEVTA